MAEIIKMGKKRKYTCKDCGCEFRYEPSDLRQLFTNRGWQSLLNCPQCKTLIVIASKENYYED